MTKIFISWWWNIQQSASFDKLYYQNLEWKSILYIPRALYPWRYDSAREWIDTLLPSSEWYKVTLLKPDENISDVDINNYDGLYIGWWNTFRLLHLVRSTWFDYIINKFIEIDKPIYWWSAWAIIFGKEINTSSDRNITKLWFDQTTWFNCFGWYSICCHYKDKLDAEIFDYVKNYNIPVIALPEEVWCYNNNNKFYIAGEWSAYLFTSQGKEAFKSWEEINLS